MNATDTPVQLPVTAPAVAVTNWRQIVTILAAAIVAAFGAGAGVGAAGQPDTPPAPALVDSLVNASLSRNQVFARLQALERKMEITGCVAEQQIEGQPLDGCRYLLQRERRGP